MADHSASTQQIPVAGFAVAPGGEHAAVRSARQPGWTVLAWLTVPGNARSVAAARQFAGTLLIGQPDVGTIVLLCSELVANSVLHSDSARDGGAVTLTVLTALAGTFRIEVADAGGPSLPLIRDPADLAPGGRGLRLVDALSARWGCYRAGDGTVTWFETAP